ncbi:MAG: hypothetical protein ACK522_06300 [Synechococcaceae cyanobacterium]
MPFVLLLCLTLLLPWPDGGGRALALGWPNRTTTAPRETPGLSNGQRLQEVPPPAAVQQLQEALADRAPQVRILAPAADALLPDEPWTLRLQVDDWPLVDGGPLGLGPHLLVRIDGGEPLRLTAPEATLPALSPGSHRLTVVAARPWGEAVKSPGAMAQIRVHRTAKNPLSLPAPGSPQLLPMSPPAVAAAEPLLLDWLLVDAPLQHLRDDDARWRLRVTVNGDSFLVDRQTALWLKGWRPGTNAVQLELLDGRGEPLNPPFNSLVQEVRVDGSLPKPAWLGGPLSPSDLAILLGQAPSPSSAPAATAATAVDSSSPAAYAEDGVEEDEQVNVREEEKATEADTDAPGQEPVSEAAPPHATTQNEIERNEIEQNEVELYEIEQNEAIGMEEAQNADLPISELPNQAKPNEAKPNEEEPNEAEPNEEEQVAQQEPPPQRPAREEVNPDGTLRREPRTGPLAGLRERLAR